MLGRRSHAFAESFLPTELRYGFSKILTIAAVDHARRYAASAEKNICLDNQSIRTSLGLPVSINEARIIDLVGCERADRSASQAEGCYQNCDAHRGDIH